MQILKDFFMMTVDQRYESSISPSGIITLNTAWVNDETIERFDNKRIYGRIEACPVGFSDQVVELVDPGFPNPRKYISGEYIEEKVNRGYWKMNNNFYTCTTFEKHDTVTCADIAEKCDIRRFDKVYFDPRVTEPENRLGSHNGKELYKIRVDQIICTVRDGEILPQGEWCLVEPDMEDWSEIMSPKGIYMKPRPEAKHLRGIMRHFQHRDDIREGDKIIYMKGADWLLKIEGKKYYAIEAQDILAKLQ